MKWVAEEMSSADLVAVASIGSTLQILRDFTGSKEAVRSTLAAFSPTDSTAFTTVDTSTAATDEANSAATDDTATVDASAQELDTFNNDVRPRALKTLAEAKYSTRRSSSVLRLDAADRRPAVFQFELPAQSLRPGLYTCQINIIDQVAGRFVFPRLELYVR